MGGDRQNHRVASKKKQVKNYLVRWGLLLGAVLFLSLTTAILLIDDEVLHHPSIVNGNNFEIALHTLAAIFSLMAVRLLIHYKARRLNDYYLSRFEKIDKLGAFGESRPRRYLPGPKPYKHAVLLLHGFTASTQEFDTLTDMLREAGIPYLAPMIPGFGTDRACVLKEANRRDWVRAATDNLELLQDLAEEVSVVGHSLGGMVSTAITRDHKVKNLILSAPGLYPTPSDVKYKVMLTRPYFSKAYMALIPYLPKPIRPGRVSPSDTLDEERCLGVFQYLAVPVHSVRQLFKLQNETDILESQYERLAVVYGIHDLTVNMDALFERLDGANKKYDVFKFENSAHNVLEDQERQAACRAVLSVIQGTNNEKSE